MAQRTMVSPSLVNVTDVAVPGLCTLIVKGLAGEMENTLCVTGSQLVNVSVSPVLMVISVCENFRSSC